MSSSNVPTRKDDIRVESDQAAQLVKEADLAKDEQKKPAKEVPGEDSKNQRVIPYEEFKAERKEAERDPAKRVSDAQVEIA